MLIAYIAYVFTCRTMIQADICPDAPTTHNSMITINIDCIVHPPHIQAFVHGNIASYTTDIQSR